MFHSFLIAFLLLTPLSESKPPSKVITLQRTVCYGPCPEYKLTIFSDGAIAYEGISSVKKEGAAKGRISLKKLQDLVREFDKINYFNLEDNYTPGNKVCPESMTDMPSVITSLTRNGKTKTITHYHGCRGLKTLELLTELENKIDAAVNISQWTE